MKCDDLEPVPGGSALLLRWVLELSVMTAPLLEHARCNAVSANFDGVLFAAFSALVPGCLFDGVVSEEGLLEVEASSESETMHNICSRK